MLIFKVTVGLLFLAAATSAISAEPQWQSVLPAIAPAAAVAGAWTKQANEVSVTAATGARLPLPVAPQGEYDFRVSFTRTTGQHSIALIFVHGGRQCAFEADAWGQHLAGFQNIAGRDIRQNPTRRVEITLVNEQRYTLTVEVRKDRIRGLLDDQELASYSTTGDDLSLSDLWRMPQANQLAIGAWNANTTFHAIEVRSHSGTPVAIIQPAARETVAKAPTPKSAPPSATTSTPTRQPTTSRPPTKGINTNGKRVLIVIANQDFFYREYSDPREELSAGFQVVVAAGRKSPCRPHNGSGQGADGGIVMPDVALAEVKAADYATVLFSGGWGSSAYQFAFPGRYNNGVYNGDPQTKTEVNRIINEFLAADKFVCALCNAVSVLAWARVDGKSPLQGKRVCGPRVKHPLAFTMDNQDSLRAVGIPRQTAAILLPPGAVGVPYTNRDDVFVDGRIITGEDDPSAREMGRVIAQSLSSRS